MNNHDIAAHSIASHLRAIARLFPYLTDEQKAVYLLRWGSGEGDITKDLIAMCQYKANSLEATAPFEKLNGQQRDEVAEWLINQLNDMSAHERLTYHVSDWTSADWRAEYDDMVDYMNEDE